MTRGNTTIRPRVRSAGHNLAVRAWPIMALALLVAGHLNQLAGEIAAAKGMQGLDGY